jgi:hypothetical protein
MATDALGPLAGGLPGGAPPSAPGQLGFQA